MSNIKNEYERSEPMVPYSLRLPPTLIEQAEKKSTFISLPRLVRILLTKYVRDEIVITDKDAEIK
jgi:hypothetical protein